jgi:hypothetical protein
MNRIVKHTIQSQWALLLLAMFVCPSLFKPVHILLAHHGHSEKVCTNGHQQAVNADFCRDCPICDFEFYTFIPQQKASVPQAIYILFDQQTTHTVNRHIRQSSHIFQLRAPPVC